MVNTWPIYAKITALVLLVYMIFYGLYIGQDILEPLGFGFLFAILLRPLEKKLINFHCPKVLAIIISIVVGLLCFVAIVTFLSKQVASFIKDIPAIKHNLNDLWIQLQDWLAHTFNLSRTEQNQIIQKATSDTMNGLQPLPTIGTITGSLAT